MPLIQFSPVAARFRERVKDLGLHAAVARRIALGVGANSFSQFVTLVLLFGTVPVLLHAWGATRYGLWIVLSAVPAYLSIGDFGFASAAANEMTISAGRGDISGARRTHQSILLVSTSALLILGGLSALVALCVPEAWLPKTAIASPAEVRMAVFFLSLSVLMSLGWNSVSAAFRADGRYASSVFYNEFVRLTDTVAVLGTALCGGSLANAALASLLVRSAGLVGGLALVRRTVPWVRLGIEEARISELRRLIGPALAVMALPLGFAISLQAMTLVVGATLGLATVALFSALRSLARLVIQLASIVTHAIAPEVSRALGRQDARGVRQLVQLNFFWAICVSVPFLLGMTLIGSDFVKLWSGGRLHPSQGVVALLVGSAALQAMWNSSGNMLLAANRQSEYSYWFIVISAASIFVAFSLGGSFGLSGIAACMVLADAAMVGIVSTKLARMVAKMRTVQQPESLSEISSRQHV